MSEDNKLYYNNEVVECEIVSGYYDDGSYYLHIKPYDDIILYSQIQGDYPQSKLKFRGNYVILASIETDVPDKPGVWEVELYILPKTIL